jgi:hypothetical protein
MKPIVALHGQRSGDVRFASASIAVQAIDIMHNSIPSPPRSRPRPSTKGTRARIYRSRVSTHSCED